MKTRFGVLGALLAAGSLAAVVGCSSASREAQAAEGKGYVPLKTPWGHPDIQGTYTTNEANGVEFERPAAFGNKAELAPEECQKWKTENEQLVRKRVTSGTGNGPAHWYEWWNRDSCRTSLVIDPADGRIPWRPEAKRGRNWAEGDPLPASWLDLTPFDRCLTRSLPIVMVPQAYNAGLQIFQTPDSVVIHYEMVHEVRVIPLDGSPHVDASIRQWMGDSRGHWEGNTLVVDVTNFTEKGDGTHIPAGTFAGGGPTMRLVERFTPVGRDRIEYKVTIEDPKQFSAPWTIVLPVVRDENYRIFEYACHEGNYALAGILGGARRQEREGTGPATAR